MQASVKAGLCRAVIAAATAIGAGSAQGEPIPINAFARLPALRDVAISPDGRYLSAIQSLGDESNALVFDIKNGGAPRGVLQEDKDGKFRMQSCNWANSTRIVCSYRGMASELGVVFGVTRLVAVNADGSKMKLLLQNNRTVGSQLNQIVSWTPDAPDTILVQSDQDANGYPEVYDLNIYTGAQTLVLRDREPIRAYAADQQGNIRMGYGLGGKELSYFVRKADEKTWIRLESFNAFARDARMEPIAVSADRNKLYASGLHEGRFALWELDLDDREHPQLVFSHPEVDADSPILAKDGHMLGVYYQSDRPFAFYTDAVAVKIMESVKPAIPPNNFVYIVDYTKDHGTFVMRSWSDIDAGTYYLLEPGAGKFQRISSVYPELESRKEELSRMQSIRYKARDGIEIPGYLTVPTGKRPENLPLIVMPHGGPTSRDTWGFDFLVQFLASRGYAVLQMNFRGSSGYGDEWLSSAHQDWGGLTYADITDGARWAIEKGIADPKRMCIVGWSFGGYAALLGAVRNGDLYKCSVSIAGVSDLIQLQNDSRFFTNRLIAREQIGLDRDKLKRDSPRRHAEEISMPVLMIHGTMDAQVRVEHSESMVSELKGAKKPHKFVKIKDATHQLDRQSDRVTLLTELESFLDANLKK